MTLRIALLFDELVVVFNETMVLFNSLCIHELIDTAICWFLSSRMIFHLLVTYGSSAETLSNSVSSCSQASYSNDNCRERLHSFLFLIIIIN